MAADEEAPGRRAERIESKAVLPEDGEERAFATPTNRIVLALVDRRLDPAFALAYLANLLNLFGREIRQTPLPDFPGLEGNVHSFARLLKRGSSVRNVQIFGVDLFDLESF